jgi:hypothetical protein
LSYNDKWAWKIKDSHSIRTGEDVISHVGNVFFYQKKYVENFGGNLLPIIVVNN